MGQRPHDFCIEITFPKIMKLYHVVLHGFIKHMCIVYYCKFVKKSSDRSLFWGSPNVLLNGYQVQSRGGGVKRPERGVDHSPPSSAKVKNEGSCTFMAYTGTTALLLWVWQTCIKWVTLQHWWSSRPDSEMPRSRFTTCICHSIGCLPCKCFEDETGCFDMHDSMKSLSSSLWNGGD